ncbi:hypothetical protein HY634_04225 [Candidatus Uhrbacteria bacterium]|nr:hypothetical protein [Candidatus Uhrbacteria bacterium]
MLVPVTDNTAHASCARESCTSMAGVSFNVSELLERGSVQTRCSDCNVPTLVTLAITRREEGRDLPTAVEVVVDIDYSRTNGKSW